MLFTTKALAVTFLTVVIASQAHSATASLAAQPDQRASVVSAAVAGSFLDVALPSGRNSMNVTAVRDGRSFVETKAAKGGVTEAKLPEPGVYSMFLAGLGIIVAMVRRRSVNF